VNDDDVVMIERYLDADLPAEERRRLDDRLRSDEPFRAAFADEFRLHRQIALVVRPVGRAEDFRKRLQLRLSASTLPLGMEQALGTSPHADSAHQKAAGAGRRHGDPPSMTRHAPRHWRRTVTVLALCMLIAVLATWALFPGRGAGTAILARITGISGSAQLQSEGRPQHPVTDGDAVRRKDRLTLGPDGHATMRFEDGTTITLAALGEVTFDADGLAKSLELRHGSLTATVTRQPPGYAMSFRTPQAVATVLGTRLTLVVDAVTRLSVEEGRVSLAPREAPGSAVIVATGQSAQASVRRALLDPALGQVTQPLWAQAVVAAVQPTAQERLWEEIPWRTDLWIARRDALSAHKPLLLWVGQGHPLGMAYSDCLIDRATAWADPAIRRLVGERFVPVALDGWFLSRRQDAVGRFFATIVAQAQAVRPNVITQGMYCITSDGVLLAQCSCGSSSAHVQQVLTDALRSFAGALPSAPVPDSGPTDAIHDPQLPEGGVVLVAYARRLISDGGAYRPAPELDGSTSADGREYVWLSAGEWHAVLSAALQAQQPNGNRAFPDGLSRKLVRNALLDTTHGEAMPWEATDITSVTLALIPDQDPGEVGHLRLAGTVRIASATRSYEAQLAGELTVSPVQSAITDFELTALGSHRGQEVSEADPQDTLLGIDLRPAAMVPAGMAPHGLRDEGYYLPLGR
jgi:hypothetical protein